MNRREIIISNYIDGYNQFDIDKMVADFETTIQFENILNGETTLLLHGLASFKEQASEAVKYFSCRNQTVTSYVHRNNETEIEVAYFAILAMDFPNGLKSGQELQLKGKSVFTFLGNKIIKLTDIS